MDNFVSMILHVAEKNFMVGQVSLVHVNPWNFDACIMLIPCEILVNSPHNFLECQCNNNFSLLNTLFFTVNFFCFSIAAENMYYYMRTQLGNGHWPLKIRPHPSHQKRLKQHSTGILCNHLQLIMFYKKKKSCPTFVYSLFSEVLDQFV